MKNRGWGKLPLEVNQFITKNVSGKEKWYSKNSGDTKEQKKQFENTSCCVGWNVFFLMSSEFGEYFQVCVCVEFILGVCSVKETVIRGTQYKIQRGEQHSGCGHCCGTHTHTHTQEHRHILYTDSDSNCGNTCILIYRHTQMRSNMGLQFPCPPLVYFLYGFKQHLRP